jgi:hypothetical protein
MCEVANTGQSRAQPDHLPHRVRRIARVGVVTGGADQASAQGLEALPERRQGALAELVARDQGDHAQHAALGEALGDRGGLLLRQQGEL